MANTFKVITRDVAPASSGSPETLYTVQSGSTVIVLGLTLANVHTAQVTGTYPNFTISAPTVTSAFTNDSNFLDNNSTIDAGNF